MKLSSNEWACGLVVPNPAHKHVLVCMRTRGHAGGCVTGLRQAADADGVCWYCRGWLGTEAHRGDCITLLPKQQDRYASLRSVYQRAVDHAEEGKGKERHAGQSDAFEEQPICAIGKALGSNHFELGQAVKKILESTRLPPERAALELLGALNYLAAAVILLEGGKR